MSAEHPIVAITGSSGAGSSAVVKAFEHIFWRERVKAVYVQGNAFHRYDRNQMEEEPPVAPLCFGACTAWKVMKLLSQSACG